MKATVSFTASLLAVLLSTQLANALTIEGVSLQPSKKAKQPEQVTITINPIETKMDVLFVVDDSGSMEFHQQNLSNNVQNLIGTLKALPGELQAGVVTSTMEPGQTSYANNEGRLVGTDRIARSSDPNFDSILAKNILVGTYGSGAEKPLDAAVAALTEPMISTDNFGFLRPDANLAIIMVTDAEDQSSISADDFQGFMTNVKTGQANVSFNAIYIPSTDTACTRDDSTVMPSKIEAVIQKMNSKTASLCDVNYSASLGQIGQAIRDLFTRNIPLQTKPNVATIKVIYGNLMLSPNDIHKGWSFDPARQMIVLGDQIDWTSQPQGTKLTVTYLSMP